MTTEWLDARLVAAGLPWSSPGGFHPGAVYPGAAYPAVLLVVAPVVAALVGLGLRTRRRAVPAPVEYPLAYDTVQE